MSDDMNATAERVYTPTNRWKGVPEDDESIVTPVPNARPKVKKKYDARYDPKAKIPCPTCHKLIASAYLRTHQRQMHNAPPFKRGRPKSEAPLVSDDVVATVLEVVFPDGVPIRHLEAVLRWRDQTIEFLKHVQ